MSIPGRPRGVSRFGRAGSHQRLGLELPPASVIRDDRQLDALRRMLAANGRGVQGGVSDVVRTFPEAMGDVQQPGMELQHAVGPQPQHRILHQGGQGVVCMTALITSV
jgi:hypothetical protein